MAQQGRVATDRSWKRIAIWLLPLVPIAVAIALPFATLLYGERTDIAGALVVGAGAVLAVIAAISLMRQHMQAAIGATLLSALALVFGGYDLGALHLRGLMLSPRLVAELAKGPCAPAVFATVGYNEPSLVFLTRTGLQMLDAKSAAGFLAKPGCRVAFVDIRQEGEFTQALTALGQAPHPLGRVLGVNLNGGRHMDIGVYTNGG
jgi:hypothetical protein